MRPALKVACLCAAWCRTCDDYRATLLAVSTGFVGRGLIDTPRWIDIEDEAELIDDVDIETFPTLLVYDDRRVLFAGPLTPQPETLQRLIESLAAADAGAARVAPEIEALVDRLRARPASA